MRMNRQKNNAINRNNEEVEEGGANIHLPWSHNGQGREDGKQM